MRRDASLLSRRRLRSATSLAAAEEVPDEAGGIHGTVGGTDAGGEPGVPASLDGHELYVGIVGTVGPRQDRRQSIDLLLRPVGAAVESRPSLGYGSVGGAGWVATPSGRTSPPS